jgi:hypothetical protein
MALVSLPPQKFTCHHLYNRDGREQALMKMRWLRITNPPISSDVVMGGTQHRYQVIICMLFHWIRFYNYSFSVALCRCEPFSFTFRREHRPRQHSWEYNSKERIWMQKAWFDMQMEKYILLGSTRLYPLTYIVRMRNWIIVGLIRCGGCYNCIWIYF